MLEQKIHMRDLYHLELQEELLREKKKIKVSKPIIAVCAAVAAVAVGTISVGAATGWGYMDYFRNMFAEKYEGSVTVLESPVQTTATEKQNIPKESPFLPLSYRSLYTCNAPNPCS